MITLLRLTVLVGVIATLAACEGSQGAYNAPGDLVDTDVFVSNVMREQGIVASGSQPQ